MIYANAIIARGTHNNNKNYEFKIEGGLTLRQK